MPSIAADKASPISVVDGLYSRTRTLHAEAEKTGVINDILRGQASREGWILLLRNLLPVYRQIELGLERHGDTPGLELLAKYRLDRAGAIEADLKSLCGEAWADSIALLPEAEAYADRVAFATEGDGARLIAHAYTRYLGDLSGGQIVQRLLAKTFGLSADQLTFYGFSRFPDLAGLKAGYRLALDQAGLAVRDPQAVIEEGAVAFTHNIALSIAVQDRMPARQ